MFAFFSGNLPRITGGCVLNNVIKTKDAMQQMGDSAELYTFVNTTAMYFFTSYNENINYGGNLYLAVPIKRSGFTTDVVEGTVRCMVQAPVSVLFSQYIAQTPFIPIQVEIRRLYLDDLTASDLRFKGTVNSISFERQVATVECLSSMDELKRTVPRLTIKSTCNHPLYSTGCGIIKNNYAINVTVVPDVSGTRLYVIGGFNPIQYGYFINGIAEYKQDTRFISDQGNDWIDVYYPFENIPANSSMRLYAGCDKTIATCKNKFNNEPNFLGMPFVKKVPNPVIKSL